MTVCISAFAAKSKAIVCIADRALTYAGFAASAETDSGVTKIIDLPGDWCAMFSCDSLTFPKNVLDRMTTKLGQGPVNRNTMEAAAKEAFEFIWWQEIEDQILKPILLKKEDFTSRSVNVQPLDTKLVMKLAEEMSEYKQVCSMIFCGFDGDVPQMFMMNTPCQLDAFDWQGFAVIGGGLEPARNQMLWQEYDRDESLQSVLYDVFSAKVATEVIQGVGFAWDWRVLIPGKSPQPMPKPIDKLIDQLWFAHNVSPFAKKPAKSDLPPPGWEKIFSAYVDGVLSPVKPPTKRSNARKSRGPQ